MLVITGYDHEGSPRRLTVSRNRTAGVVLRLYQPRDGEDFLSDLEGSLIGGIILDAADTGDLGRSL